MELTGKTVLITGAGTSMGLVAAREFSRRGNRVIMVARNAKRLRTEADKLERADAFACDVSDSAQVDRLLDWVRANAPELDMLFLNAGVTHSYRLFDGTDAAAHARQEMEINFVATVDLTQRFVPLIQDRTGAALIITTSGVIYAPDNGNPTYSATKAALHSYVQSLRFQLGQNGVSLPVFERVSPLVDTPFASGVKSDVKATPKEVIDALFVGLAADTIDIRPGSSQPLYEAWREDPAKAAKMVNEATGV